MAQCRSYDIFTTPQAGMGRNEGCILAPPHNRLSITHIFSTTLKPNLIERDWKDGLKTPRVGLLIGLPARFYWFFCFSAARSRMMSSLVSDWTEKQKTG